MNVVRPLLISTLSCCVFQDDTSSNMVIEAIKNDTLHQMERNL